MCSHSETSFNIIRTLRKKDITHKMTKYSRGCAQICISIEYIWINSSLSGRMRDNRQSGSNNPRWNLSVCEPPSHTRYLKCLTILRRQTGNYQVFTGWNALQLRLGEVSWRLYKVAGRQGMELTTRLMCVLSSRNKNEGGGLQKSHSFCFLKTAGLEGAFCPQYWADPPLLLAEH